MTDQFSRNDLEPISIDSPKPCCGIRGFTGMAMMLVTTASLCIAAFFIGRMTNESDSPGVSQSVHPEGNAAALESGYAQWIDQLPLAHATASATSEKYSVATGSVSDESEGFFVLDHNSGLLQCNVIYPRRGQFLAKFQVNVAEALGTGGKGGQYIMVTGRADFIRSNTNPAAPVLVYVLDVATGNYAAFGVPFNETFVARGQPQQGTLVLVGTGSANPLIDRDRLR